MLQKLSNVINPEKVKEAHNAMAEEYDQMEDLWYPWLYSQMHEFIISNIDNTLNDKLIALDIGCGTGIQSFLLSKAGIDVLGIDISEDLLKKAIDKTRLQSSEKVELFYSRNFDLKQHNLYLQERVSSIRSNIQINNPSFIIANIESYDFNEKFYDIIVCCGSVLSFINSYEDVINKMSKGIKSNGKIFIEVEQKWNFDLFWPFFDKLLFGLLHYEQTWKEIFNNLFFSNRKSVKINYPFIIKNGNEVVLPIWLFSIPELKNIFNKYNLKIIDQCALHCFTNLIPSTILHTYNPSQALIKVFKGLTILDKKICRRWPFKNFGCSVIFELVKNNF